MQASWRSEYEQEKDMNSKASETEFTPPKYKIIEIAFIISKTILQI